MVKAQSRYDQIMEHIFLKKFEAGVYEVPFEREDFVEAGKAIGMERIKNLGDIVYSYRYRTELPDTIKSKAKKDYEWVIRSTGKSKYNFSLAKHARFYPNASLMNIKIPDATPGIVAKYSLDDEQALLAKVRYNRLIDVFSSVTCYSLQSHFRTTIKKMGGVETDEVYLGIDKHGVHHVFTVQAKGGSDKIGVVQVEQDFEVCKEKYPQAIAHPIAVQFIDKTTIVMFEFSLIDDVEISTEKHYRLVHPDQLSKEEIQEYQRHSPD